MTNDEFRRWGHTLIDWIADYLANVESYPGHVPGRAGRDPRPAAGRARPCKASRSTPSSATSSRSSCRASPTGSRPTSSPSSPRTTPARRSSANCSRPGLGVQGMLWATSPACTELETHVLDWMVDMLGLPPAFKSTSTGGGVIQDSASSATLCAILAARERATGGQSNLRGADGSLVAYTSTQAHSSVEKGVRIAGLGSDNLRLIDVDEQFRHAARPAGRGHRGRPGGRPPPVLRLRDGRHHLVDGHRSARRDRPHLPRARPLAARRRRPGRHGRPLPRVPLPPRRPGTGRQLLLQSAQVDVHQLRLRLLLRGRPGAADPHAEHPARVSAQPGDASRAR